MNLFFKSLMALTFLPTAFGVAPALSAEVIGLSLPMSKRYAEISKRFELGALIAQGQLNDLGRDIEIKLVDDNCDSATVPELSKQLTDAKAIIGLPCFKVATQLARAFKANQMTVPVLTMRTRNPALKRLREVENLSIIEFSNAPDAEAKAVMEFILPKFGSKPYAILDDGSVYGRGLADTVRLLAEQNGLKPITNANFRPLQTNQRALIRRLQRSGVEAVFIAADAEDVATIANDIAALNLTWPVATGEQISLLPFAEGAKKIKGQVIAVAPTARALLTTEIQKISTVLDASTEPEIVLGYVMVEVASQLIKTPDAKEFETILGKVKIGPDARINVEPFQLYQWSNGQLSTIESN